MDTLSEFSTVNSRFTALSTGNYLVSAQLGVHGVADQGYVDIIIYINGAYQLASRTAISGTTTGQQPKITDVLRLSAGDYVEIFVYSGGAFVVEEFGVFNWLRIQRVA
ncbi:hypothetical protein D3C75_1103620 [compost metagenome]